MNELSFFSPSNLGLTFIFFALFAFLIHQIRVARSQERLAGSSSTTSKLLKIFVAGFLLHQIALNLLAPTGLFLLETLPPPFLIVPIPFFILIGILLKVETKKDLQLMKHLAPATLILLHVFRIPIEVILASYYDADLLPIQMTYHSLNQDILIGFLAIPAGILVLMENKLSRPTAFVFHSLGILSLMNIISIVARSIPGPLQVFENNLLLSFFPGSLIVTVATTAFLLHIFGLKQAKNFPDLFSTKDQGKMAST